MAIYSFIDPPIDRSIHPPIDRSIHPPINQSIHPSICVPNTLERARERERERKRERERESALASRALFKREVTYLCVSFLTSGPPFFARFCACRNCKLRSYKRAVREITVHRDGLLRAPLPSSPIGTCSYADDISDLEVRVRPCVRPSVRPCVRVLLSA